VPFLVFYGGTSKLYVCAAGKPLTRSSILWEARVTVLVKTVLELASGVDVASLGRTYRKVADLFDCTIPLVLVAVIIISSALIFLDMVH
jgi:hypothetical protein